MNILFIIYHLITSLSKCISYIASSNNKFIVSVNNPYFMFRQLVECDLLTEIGPNIELRDVSTNIFV